MIWQPSDDALSALADAVVSRSAGLLENPLMAHGELTVHARAEQVVDALTFLRDDRGLQNHQLIDVCGADYPQRLLRFDVVYHLLSMTKNRRIRVKVQTDEDTAIPSVTSVHPGAEWFEREAFDMYGVFFAGHPDLRRLLTEYGFHGHPMRKDFPMTG